MILDRVVQERGAGQVGVGGPLMAEDPDRDPHPAGPRSAWVAAWSAGPEAVVVPAGVLSPRPVPAVFGRGTTTPLSWRHRTATAWTGWQSLAGTITSSPAAISTNHYAILGLACHCCI
jgi:hypothetical protein